MTSRFGHLEASVRGTAHEARRSLVVMLAVLLAALLIPLADVQPADAQASSPEAKPSLEQQLVDTYAPIVMIKEQRHECSTNGEQFRPVVVDIIFGTDDVRLMRRRDDGKPAEEIKRNIQASDLYGLDDRYYLDLPFDPRNPGCDYEKWGQKRMAELGITPSLYAFVSHDKAAGKIVIQYWYYWIYNLFNDVHESDWEGIQLVFDATSVEQILDQQLLPSQLAFAQHAGGELGTIGQSKVEMRGTHVVSHPSSGSHADYYESAVWLGWGEDGSGFGCDHADEPEIEIPVHIVLLPNEVADPDSEFAWLTFEGNWGEVLVPSLFSGPKGPVQHWRWHHTVEWTELIRDSSLAVPGHPTIGPGISQVFCGATVFGSRLVQIFGVSEHIIDVMIIGFIVGLLLFSLMVWRYTWQAVRMYFRHGYFFITVGVFSFPIAVIGQQLEVWAQDHVEAAMLTSLPNSIYLRSLWEWVVHSLAGSIQELLMLMVIGPIVIIGTYLIYCAEEGKPAGTWHQNYGIYPRIAASRALYSVLIGLMVVSVVLLPLAILKGVQWYFAPQAVAVENASVRQSLRTSRGRVDGDWILSSAMVVAIVAMIGLPGPLIGTALLMLGGVDLQTSQWISAVLFCVLYPIGTIAGTLFYLRRSTAPGRATPYMLDGRTTPPVPGTVTA